VEKGWADVELKVSGKGGHSSTPPKETLIGILSNAISNLEKKQQPARFGDGVEYDTIRYVAPYASFGYKMVLGNLWLFGPIVSKIFSNDHATDAIQRTTTAVTIIRGGVKSNVLPSDANAVVNHRIHPADTIETVIAQDIKNIDDDRVKVSLMDGFGASEATFTSSYDSDFVPFQIIANSIRDIFSDAILTPGTMVGGTDTKHYLHLCDAIYRFQPVRLTKSGISMFHGTDEKISVNNFNQVVEFFYRVIHNANFDIQEKQVVMEASALSEEKQSNNDDVFDALAPIETYDVDYEDRNNSTVV